VIKQSLEPFFYVVCVEYVLEDKKGKQFGADGNKYFNRRYTVGIATGGRLLVDSIGIYPWVGDPFYDEYRNNTEYKPTLYKIRIRPVRSREYLAKEVDFAKPVLLSKDNHQLWFYTLPDSTLPSIPMRNMATEKTDQVLSVMVQLGAKCDLEQNDTCKLDINVLTWGNLQRKNKLLSFIKPLNSGTGTSTVNSNSNKFLGGGCVQFEVTPGEIKMSLVGYIQQLPNKSWGVIDFADITPSVKPKQLTPTAPEPSDPKKSDAKGATKGNHLNPKGETSPKGGAVSENKKSGKNNQSNND